MNYRVILKDNYDEKYKIDSNHKVFCYSKKQLNKLHPNNDYVVIGEAKKNNKKDEIGKLSVSGTELIISKLGENSRIIYSAIKYVCVGNNTYVVLLENRIPFILILLTLLAGIMIVGGLLMKEPETPDVPVDPDDDEVVVIIPDHPLPDIDNLLQKVEGDDSQKVESEEGGGSVSMIYTLSANITLSSGEIDMHFVNPNASNHDVVIELYILSNNKEYIVARSGRIPAGNKLSKMNKIEGSATLQEGVYSGLYKVIFYNPQTGERALVESAITDLEVTAKN